MKREQPVHLIMRLNSYKSTKYIWQSVNSYEGWNENIKSNAATIYANILITYFAKFSVRVLWQLNLVQNRINYQIISRLDCVLMSFVHRLF